MGQRDPISDRALVDAHPWIAEAGRREVKRRLKIGSSRADRLIAMARAARQTSARVGPTEAPHVLVVGDAHFEPGNGADRARWLGRLIRDRLGPDDHVVIIGDWHGLTSLCSHSSPREREGHRLADDIEAGNAAIRAMYAEMLDDCAPTVWVTLGNHEQRLQRLAEERPEYNGIAGLDLLEWGTYGAHVVPYLEPLRIPGVGGWRFQHCLPNKGGRGMVVGVYMAAALLRRVHHAESVVVGHSHILQAHQVASAAGGRRWGISAGCYFDHHERYAGHDSNAEWWPGLVMLRHARNGDAGVECIPYAHVRDMYG